MSKSLSLAWLNLEFVFSNSLKNIVELCSLTGSKLISAISSFMSFYLSIYGYGKVFD